MEFVTLPDGAESSRGFSSHVQKNKNLILIKSYRLTISKRFWFQFQQSHFVFPDNKSSDIIKAKYASFTEMYFVLLRMLLKGYSPTGSQYFEKLGNGRNCCVVDKNLVEVEYCRSIQSFTLANISFNYLYSSTASFSLDEIRVAILFQFSNWRKKHFCNLFCQFPFLLFPKKGVSYEEVRQKRDVHDRR